MGEMERKKRRTRGSGGIYQKHRAGCPRPKKENGDSKCDCVWWISYIAPSGKSEREPGGKRKGDAERLLQRRIGSKELGLPVIPRAERLTFDDAAKDVINDFVANNKRSIVVARRRIEKHLTPFFGGRRMAGITSADVRAYVAKRQTQIVVLRKEHRSAAGEIVPAKTKPVANATINRELQMLKRCFSLAIQSGRIASRPHIAMLREAPARSGFFDRAEIDAVIAHLPADLGAVIEFAFITGWRQSEVLTLEWRQVDFAADEVRLFAGMTKNGLPRTFPLTTDLRRLLKAREAAHTALKQAGHITPLVFWRMVAKGRGGDKKPRKIITFAKAWRKGCAAAGCPGRIPHDLRRSAVRTFTRAGISEHAAMKLSGHLTASIFARYDIVSENDLRSAANALDAAAGFTATTAANR
jgi:integrase